MKKNFTLKMQVFMIIDREIIMEKLATYYGK